MRRYNIGLLIILTACISQPSTHVRSVEEILKKYTDNDIITPTDNDSGYTSPDLKKLPYRFYPYYYRDNDSVYIPPRQYRQPEKEASPHTTDADNSYRYPYPSFEDKEAYKKRSQNGKKNRLFETPLFY